MTERMLGEIKQEKKNRQKFVRKHFIKEMKRKDDLLMLGKVDEEKLSKMSVESSVEFKIDDIEDNLDSELKKNGSKVYFQLFYCIQTNPRSKMLADMILNISNEEYDKIDPGKFLKPVIFQNLPRAIRLRNINKYRIDVEDLNSENEIIVKFQKNRRKNALENYKLLRKLTPPRFIQKEFRPRTVEKYKSLICQFNNLK